MPSCRAISGHRQQSLSPGTTGEAGMIMFLRPKLSDGGTAHSSATARGGCLVLSPYVKRGYISKVLHSHISLVKFCETTFGLNARDAVADDMSDCFDFTQKPSPSPSVRK